MWVPVSLFRSVPGPSNVGLLPALMDSLTRHHIMSSKFHWNFWPGGCIWYIYRPRSWEIMHLVASVHPFVCQFVRPLVFEPFDLWPWFFVWGSLQQRRVIQDSQRFLRIKFHDFSMIFHDPFMFFPWFWPFSQIPQFFQVWKMLFSFSRFSMIFHDAGNPVINSLRWLSVISSADAVDQLLVWELTDDISLNNTDSTQGQICY